MILSGAPRLVPVVHRFLDQWVDLAPCSRRVLFVWAQKVLWIPGGDATAVFVRNGTPGRRLHLDLSPDGAMGTQADTATPRRRPQALHQPPLPRGLFAGRCRVPCFRVVCGSMWLVRTGRGPPGRDRLRSFAVLCRPVGAGSSRAPHRGLTPPAILFRPFGPRIDVGLAQGASRGRFIWSAATQSPLSLPCGRQRQPKRCLRHRTPQAVAAGVVVWSAAAVTPL